MWKFKASKYKNAVPKIPKQEEWITEINASNLNSCYGNHIKASAAYVVFNVDQAGGSSLGVLPIAAKGRYNGANLPMIQAHSDFVTDFDFNPFDDFLLATCSQDATAKVWHLPVDGIKGTLCNPVSMLTQEEKRIENVSWNPVADNILALTVHQSVKVFDVSKKSVCFELNDHDDQIQNVSWKGDGSMIVTSSRDKFIRVFDVRTSKKKQAVAGLQNNKDSRVLWLGNRDLILTSGFNLTRQREVVVRDVRNFNNTLKTLTFDSSTGVVMPVYDSDTDMLFLGGKGDTSIRYLEVSDTDLVENSVETVQQIKGLALLPKRALDVMKCEVNRLLLLSQQSIIPIPYIVPRKSYRDFHSDLFPETFSGVPPLKASQWLNGAIPQKTTVSLDPLKKCTLLLKRKSGSDGESDEGDIQLESKITEKDISEITSSHNTETDNLKDDKDPDDNRSSPVENQSKLSSSDDQVTKTGHLEEQEIREKKTAKVLSGVRQSKFRHLHGSAMHKSLNIENVRNLSKSIPGESDYFHANRTFCAVPLDGAGGLIGIIQTEKRGRLPDGALPALQNASSVTDFVWDPFNDYRLAVGCEDAKIRIWKIPKGGLTETYEDPSFCLRGHTEKVYFLRFHPLASDVLASGAYDMTVRLWDLQSEEEIIQLKGHTDTIFSFAWSQNGHLCATSCKDGKIRIYDPRKSVDPILVGVGLEGSRGGRLVWACNDKLLVATGFDRSSVRQIAAYDPLTLSSLLFKIDLDTSPAILVPFYDPDSSTLFLTGRGDSTVKAYEASEDYPHLYALSDFKADRLHQSLAFLPKCEVDVKTVEFARAFRLTANSIEPVSFKVPRVKMDYFQDDLFPDTKVTWEPVLSSSDWFSGSNGSQKTISLKPDDMIRLSEAPQEAPKQQKYQSFETYKATYKTDEQKKEELLSAMTNKLGFNEGPMAQDLMEGVDPSEWDD